jgi:molybdate transport system substrate-binding protein
MVVQRIALASAVAVAAAASAQPSEVRVLCSNGLRAVMLALQPVFERETPHRVRVDFAPAAIHKSRIAAAEPFDLAVLTAEAIDDEVAQGRLTPASRVVIARSNLGLAMKAGAAKPSIDTVEGLVRTLHAARSVAYAAQGASAKPFEALIDRFGLADLRPRLKTPPSGPDVANLVVTGAAEYGVLPVSELVSVTGLALAGIFPNEVQSPVVMVGAVATKAASRSAAESLLAFLTSPRHAEVLARLGMER